MRCSTRARSVAVRDLVLVQDNRYTVEGSALNGTMTGGALPVELEVRVDASDAAVSTVPGRRWTASRGWTALARPIPPGCFSRIAPGDPVAGGAGTSLRTG